MSALSPEALLRRLPHRPPMRFLSEILEVNSQHILAGYTWTDEDCAGHFPGFPVVPGVKLIECAAQAGCAAWGIYHLAQAQPTELLDHYIGFFSAVEEAVFLRPVLPGDRVLIRAHFGDEGYFRANKIVSEVSMTLRDGSEVFRARLSGVLAPREEAALVRRA